MKTPQRRFTVEFKSSRRQPRERTNSLWGDTDLKAFAREVDEMHSFGASETTVAAADTRGNPPLDAGSGSEPSGKVSGAPAVPSGGETNIGMLKGHEPTTAEVVERSQRIQAVLKAKTKPTHVSRKIVPRASDQAMTDILKVVVGDQNQNLQANAVNYLRSFEAIDVLEAENKRLKKMLAEQLQVENMQLRKMLERCNARGTAA